MGFFSQIEPNDGKKTLMADKILNRAAYKMVSSSHKGNINLYGSSFKLLPHNLGVVSDQFQHEKLLICCKSSEGCSTECNCNLLHHTVIGAGPTT